MNVAFKYLAFTAFIAISCQETKKPLQAGAEDNSQVAISSGGMVATAHPLATRAGISIKA